MADSGELHENPLSKEIVDAANDVKYVFSLRLSAFA